MGLIIEAYIFRPDDKAPSNNTVISREKDNPALLCSALAESSRMEATDAFDATRKTTLKAPFLDVNFV